MVKGLVGGAPRAACTRGSWRSAGWLAYYSAETITLALISSRMIGMVRQGVMNEDVRAHSRTLQLPRWQLGQSMNKKRNR